MAAGTASPGLRTPISGCRRGGISKPGCRRDWNRAAAPHTRLKMIAALHEAGVPVGVLVAPVIPMITDRHLEHILEAAHAAGAQAAGYVLLRLPHELKQVWREWLALQFPERAEHVMSLVRQMRGGKGP